MKIVCPLFCFRTEAMCESKPPNDCCPNCRERLVDVRETALMLSISEKSIRNQMSAGQFAIRHYKLGGRVLFKMSEILAFIDSLE